MMMKPPVNGILHEVMLNGVVSGVLMVIGELALFG